MEDVIKTAIEEALAGLGIEPVDFTVEHPSDMSHGDFACNVAMVVAKEVRQSPREVAEQLHTKLEGQIEYVEKIEVAGPGFLNFYLARDFFTAELMRAVSLGDKWGRNKSEKGEVVLIEYTSPNLFKPLHVGNLVGNIVGESLTRLYEFAGADVKRMNYPSDIGLPVAKAVWGLKETGNDPTDIIALGEAYRIGNAAYEKEGVEKDEIVLINQKLYAGTDVELLALRSAGVQTSKARINELCEMLGTHFDTEIFESQASEPGTAIVKAHIGDVFEESEGAVVYSKEKSGLHTRVFLNSKGLPTYEAKDIGHFMLKSTAYPQWTQSIIVTGGEQTEYFKVVFSALRKLFPEIAKKSLVHIPTGFLTLTTGKMSSRLGNVLTGESLLEEMEEAARERVAESRTDDVEVLIKEIAVAALKYQILRHGFGSNIVFDKEKAISFEGDSGPYLQYTHARICSVLEKASTVGVTPQTKVIPLAPYKVEKILARFEEVVKSALDERAPHKVTTYLTELAGEYNTFYAQEKIADANDEFAPYKATVADAVHLTLKNGLWVLGIKAPERM